MITKKEINDNINTKWKIEQKILKKYKYGLCKFIIDTSYELNLSKTTTALAMHIVNYFFIKNCYFNYDKLTVACSALTLSIKSKSNKKEILDKIYQIYITNKSSDELEIKTKLSNREIINLRNLILDKEISILKLFDNSLPDQFPFEYIYLYSKILYPNNEEEIYNLGNKICVDSYFTYVNNIYQTYIVALACIFIASKFLDIKNFFEKDFKNLDKMKYIHEKNMDENQFIKALYKFIDDPINLMISENGIDYEKNKEKYFNELNIDKKLHPLLKMNDLLDCIEMISDFYEEIKKNYIKK